MSATLRHRGMTLLEVLVAIAVLAVLAGLGWRAVEQLLRTRETQQSHQTQRQWLQSSLSQWRIDLLAAEAPAEAQSQDWDGRVLRITRKAPAPQLGWMVVAWTVGEREGRPHWLRWASPSLRTVGEWQTAWAAAAQWAQTPTEALRQGEWVLVPVESWQLFYARAGTWSNPLSSAGTTAQESRLLNASGRPEGVRLRLVLPAPHPLTGTLQWDVLRASPSGGTP